MELTEIELLRLELFEKGLSLRESLKKIPKGVDKIPILKRIERLDNWCNLLMFIIALEKSPITDNSD